jgi:predicted metallo-beta-lactamase superfamily hydrolase
MVAAAAAREVLWLKTLLVDYGVGGMSMQILCDSQCAISFAKNCIVSQSSKHIVVVHHFVRERVQAGHTTLEHCNTQGMVLVSLARVVGTDEFIFCGAELGLVGHQKI